MRLFSAFALVAGSLSICAEALQLHKRTDGPPRVVGMPMERKSVPDPILRDRIRRRGTVKSSLQNKETLYFANCTIGTPAQGVRLHIDTGSSDLWVNTPSSALCGSRKNFCGPAGTYTANSSSTYEYIASNFNISYVDGSGATGDHVKDTMTIGGTTLDTLQFGIGYASSSQEGILGIGYQINEEQVQRARKSVYNNLPAQLVENNQIQSNSYSLWLNDLSASTGSILFGGVDTEQYTGSLATLPIQRVSGQFAEFLITLTDVSMDSSPIASNQATAVLLDSGSSLTYLPNAITAAIYQQVGAVYDPSQGAGYVPCSLAKNTSTIDFTFSNPTISVPMDELVLQTSSGITRNAANGAQSTCLFGIAPAGSSTAVLGDTFIRSAYLVYDLENNEISLAQTKFNATGTNVMEIGTGDDGVPDATLVQNSVSATGISSGGGGTAVEIGTGKTSWAGRASPSIGTVLVVTGGLIYAAL